MNMNHAQTKISFLNIHGLSHHTNQSKLGTLQHHMVAYRLPFVFLSECHLSDSAWTTFNYEHPNWYGQRVAQPNSPSREFGVLVREDQYNSCRVKPQLIEGLPANCVALMVHHNRIQYPLVVVHAPNQHSLKRRYFRDMKCALEAHEGFQPILVGDFNWVLDPRDRDPQPTAADAGASQLKELVASLNACDAWLKLRSVGASDFTYVSTARNHRSRIDRIYLPLDWQSFARHWESLPFPKSDHCLISLSLNTQVCIGQKRPWRLNPKVLTPEGVLECSTLLQRFDSTQNSLEPQWLSIKADCASRLASLQRKRANRLNTRIKTLIRRHQRAIAKGKEVSHIVDVLASALEDYGSTSRLVNFDRWRRLGDQANPYTLYETHKRSPPTIIEALRSNASSEASDQSLPSIVHDFYSSLYSHEPVDETASGKLLSLLRSDLQAKGVPSGAISALDAEITEDEVVRSIASLPSGKAPGPDGLGVEFYRECLAYVVPILTKVYNGFLQGVKPSANFTHSIVTLLFKKGDPTLLKNYGPISLLNVDYKIFTKLLSLRLTPAFNKRIWPTQTAFLLNRDTGDGIRDVQMTLHYLEYTDNPSILLFLDQEKAYDRVNHGFLFRTLKVLGMPSGMRQAIRALYATARSTVLVNGIECATFAVKRGVRQGDPLSCVLFICVMACLQCLLERNSQIGIQLPRAQPMKYTMYADDTVIALPSWDAVPSLLSDLNQYCLASGALFNTEKTEVLTRGDVEPPPSNLPAPQPTGTPVRHLGIPVGRQLGFESSWGPTLQRLLETAKSLRLQHLSLPGRIMAIRTLVLPKALFLARYLYVSPSQLHRVGSVLGSLIWRDRRVNVIKTSWTCPPVKADSACRVFRYLLMLLD